MDKPQIDLKTEHMWCHKHWMAAMDRGHAAYALANVHLFGEVAADDRFMDLCRPPGEEQADANLMQQALAQIAPACCWVGSIRLDAVLQKAYRFEKPGGLK